jgi:hypothetical protein
MFVEVLSEAFLEGLDILRSIYKYIISRYRLVLPAAEVVINVHGTV